MSVEGGHRALPAMLAGLKREGSGLLVVGDPAGQRALCARLRGADSRQRARVVVETGDEHRDCCAPPRTASTTTIAARQPVPADTGGRSGSITPLSTLASTVVAELDARIGHVGAGDLRVCLGPIDPLVAATDADQVATFLDAVLQRVEQASGMAHVHVDASRDSTLVTGLQSQFDAVVEARGDPTPQQRWHLPARGTATPWLPVED